MLNALKQDKDVLFYNVFGTVRIEKNKITVFVNAVRAAKLHSRTITEELNNPVVNFDIPFSLSFGAWLEETEDVHFAVSAPGPYENETYNSNREIVGNSIRRAVLLLSGTLL